MRNGDPARQLWSPRPADRRTVGDRRSGREEGGDIAQQEVRHRATGGGGRAPDVREQHYRVQVGQGIRDVRFVGVDIKPGAAQVPVDESSHESVLVDHGAACHVDQDAGPSASSTCRSTSPRVSGPAGIVTTRTSTEAASPDVEGT